jgi:hypothetical protein
MVKMPATNDSIGITCVSKRSIIILKIDRAIIKNEWWLSCRTLRLRPGPELAYIESVTGSTR